MAVVAHPVMRNSRSSLAAFKLEASQACQALSRVGDQFLSHLLHNISTSNFEILVFLKEAPYFGPYLKMNPVQLGSGSARL